MRDTIQVPRMTKKAIKAFTGNSVFTLKTSSCGLNTRRKAEIHKPGKTRLIPAQMSRRLRSGRPQGRGGFERPGTLSGISGGKNTPVGGEHLGCSGDSAAGLSGARLMMDGLELGG